MVAEVIDQRIRRAMAAIAATTAIITTPRPYRISPAFPELDLRLIARYDTAIRMVIAPIANAWKGNSGMPPPLPPVVELVELWALEVVEELVEVLEA